MSMDVAEIAGRLSAPQQKAMRFGPDATGVFAKRGVMAGLMRRGLVVDDGGYPPRIGTLTDPLGLAVRAYFRNQDTDHD